MDNLALQIIDEELPQDSYFVISNDQTAEWAIKKIAEERAETQRYINVCDTMIADYAMKKQKAQEYLVNKTSFLIGKLQEYFLTVPHKEAKTQETYKLPSGTLKMKYGTPEFVRDEEKLLKWAKENAPECVKVKETANWAEIKKNSSIAEERVVTNDGEIVEGVSVVWNPNRFEVEI